MLSHRVHLDDVGAARKQAFVDGVLVGQGHPVGRQHHQRRTAARHQGDDQIIRGQSLHGGKDLASGLLAHRVGRWMRGFQHLDPARGRTLAVARDHDAAEIDVAPGGVERRRHRHRGLAGPDHHATTFWFLRQMPQHRRTGIGAGDRRVEHPSQQAACRSVGPAGGSHRLRHWSFGSPPPRHRSRPSSSRCRRRQAS